MSETLSKQLRQIADAVWEWAKDGDAHIVESKVKEISSKLHDVAREIEGSENIDWGDKFKHEQVNANCFKLYLFGHFIGTCSTMDATLKREKSIADGINRYIHFEVNRRYISMEHARELKISRERDVLEYKLRKWMWENHGKHSGFGYLYGDDGEMQCNSADHGPIDFRREPIAQLEARIFEWHMKQINEAGKKLEMEVSKFVDSEDKCVCYPKPERFIPHQSCGAVGRAL